MKTFKNLLASLALALSSLACAGDVVEVLSPDKQHYFMTQGPELKILLADGWTKTGESFKDGGSNFVCRFYIPNAHYFTVHTDECAQMVAISKTLPKYSYWTLEGSAFRSTPPKGGTHLGVGVCIGMVPIYHAFNPKNLDHRFTSNLKAILELVDTGWIWGDVAMCAPLPAEYPLMWNQPREHFLTKIEGCDSLAIDRNGFIPDANGRQAGPIDLYVEKCDIAGAKVKVWLARLGGNDQGWTAYGDVPDTMEVYVKRVP